MTELNTQDHNDFHLGAKLHSIEDGLAYFTYDENVLTWPADKLPKEMEIGDQADFVLNFNLTEEKIKQQKKKEEDNEKYHKMRELLQELVN